MPHEDILIGHGYDLHRLAPWDSAGLGIGGSASEENGGSGGLRPLLVGGVDLESDGARRVGVVAHSDGDVLLHAVVDAMMGAVCGPDIGQMFPNSDPANRARPSREFVMEAARRVRVAGFRLVNMDATVVLESPRLSRAGIKEAMRRNIAELTGLAADRINIKGKTHEGVGAIGQGLAIEAHVVVLMRACATGMSG